MKVPILTTFLARREFLIQLQNKEIENRRLQIDLQTKLIEQKKELTESITNISKPTNALSSDLYSNVANGIWDSSGYNTGWWSFDNERLRRASRIAYWESPTGRAIIKRYCDVVVGSGLELQLMPMWNIIYNFEIDKETRKKITKNIELRFKNWAQQKKVDYLIERDFYQIQWDLFFYLLRDGEYFVIFRYSPSMKSNPLSIQIIPPENISATTSLSEVSKGNKLINGIEYNKDKAVAYHVFNEDTNESVRVPRFGSRSGRTFVLHIYRKDNEKQRRGIPLLAMSMPQLTNLADLLNLELKAMIINSIFAIFIKPPDNIDGQPTISKGINTKQVVNGKTIKTSDSDYLSDLKGLDFEKGGVILDQWPAGHGFESFKSERPNANFEKFYTLVKQSIATSADIPLSVVDYNFSQSYSGARGELLVFWMAVNKMVKNHGKNFCAEVFKMWMWGEVDNGIIDAPGWENEDTRNAWCNASWNGEQRPDIDPLKSVRAHKEEQTMAYKTGQQIAAERGGGDYDENLEAINNEFANLTEATRTYIELNKGGRGNGQ